MTSEKPEEERLPWPEIRRRVLVHIERIQRARAQKQAMTEAQALELTWDEIRAEVKVHLKRADLHRAKLAEAKRQAQAAPAAKPKQRGLFDDPVALANEIARVRAAIAKKRQQQAVTPNMSSRPETMEPKDDTTPL